MLMWWTDLWCNSNRLPVTFCPRDEYNLRRCINKRAKTNLKIKHHECDKGRPAYSQNSGQLKGHCLGLIPDSGNELKMWGLDQQRFKMGQCQGLLPLGKLSRDPPCNRYVVHFEHANYRTVDPLNLSKRYRLNSLLENLLIWLTQKLLLQVLFINTFITSIIVVGSFNEFLKLVWYVRRLQTQIGAADKAHRSEDRLRRWRKNTAEQRTLIVEEDPPY